MFHLNSKRLIDTAIMEFAMDFYKSEDKLNLEIDIPYAILNERSSVVWSNKAFDEIFQKDMSIYNNLERVLGKFDLKSTVDTSEFCIRHTVELMITPCVNGTIAASFAAVRVRAAKPEENPEPALAGGCARRNARQPAVCVR